MHLPLLLAAAASLAVTQAAPDRPATQRGAIPPAPVDADGQACPPLTRHATGVTGTRPRLLVDAPPAPLWHAVDRRDGRCPVPALVPGAPAR